MPINEGLAKEINEINKLIHNFRTVLTTGEKNASGGYPVRAANLDNTRPQTLDLEYGKNDATQQSSS